MIFTISKNKLYGTVVSLSKVLNSKNTIPALDNFLLQIADENVFIMASDGDNVLQAGLELTSKSIPSSFSIQLPSYQLLEFLRNLGEQSLQFEIDEHSLSIRVTYEQGRFEMIGFPGEEYPEFPKMSLAADAVSVPADIMGDAIERSAFSVSSDVLKPIMCGIHFYMNDQVFEAVATNNTSLAKHTYQMKEMQGIPETHITVPLKACKLLKSFNLKANTDVVMSHDSAYILFEYKGDKLMSRLIEGVYPNYNSVIPEYSSKESVQNREQLLAALRRISVLNDKETNAVNMRFYTDGLYMWGRDIHSATQTEEILPSTYQGWDFDICFDSLQFISILENIVAEEVLLRMEDNRRNMIVTPVGSSDVESHLFLISPKIIE